MDKTISWSAVATILSGMGYALTLHHRNNKPDRFFPPVGPERHRLALHALESNVPQQSVDLLHWFVPVSPATVAILSRVTKHGIPSHHILEAIFDSVYDAIFVHTVEGTLLDVNQKMLELYRVKSKEEALSYTIAADYSTGDEQAGQLVLIWEDVATGNTRFFEWVARRPVDGTTFDAQIYLTPLQLPGRTLILASVRDVTERNEMMAELEQSRRRFEDVATITGDWLWETDALGRFTYVSDRAQQWLGYSSEELIGRVPFNFLTPHDADKGEREPYADQEDQYIARDGTTGYSLTNAIPKFDAGGEFSGYLGVVKDITERKQAELQRILFEKVYENAIEGITVTSRDGTIISVNAAFTAITGYAASEAIGMNPRILKSDRHDAHFYQEMWSGLEQEGRWAGEIWNRKKSGESYPEWLAISAIYDEQESISHFVGVFHDITEMKHKEEQIRHQALHDALTGLPNRTLLHDRLSMTIRHAERHGGVVSILFFDLDSFKTINDSLGHSVGDILLQQVAERVKERIRTEDTLARLGGDEFVILLEEADHELLSLSVAERVIESFERPFVVREQELFVTASMGIAFYPDDGNEPEMLIRNADLAMYRAKSEGKNRHRLYTPQLNRDILDRLELETSLRKALETDEFVIALQPRIEAESGRVVGAESLVRWKRADGSVVSPGSFIPVAEETGLITRLDELVLEKTCSFISTVSSLLPKDFRVSVNVSSRQIQDPDLVTAISGTLSKMQFPPEHLELEITETSLMTEIEHAAKNLTLLSRMGIEIAIDDFGTGYSSLYKLRKLPLHSLKIDRSFVADLTADSDDAQIVATIIAMAKQLRLRVVAEGVETKEQMAYLVEKKCDQLQGFYISRPLPPAEFSAFLMAGNEAT